LNVVNGCVLTVDDVVRGPMLTAVAEFGCSKVLPAPVWIEYTQERFSGDHA